MFIILLTVVTLCHARTLPASIDELILAATEGNGENLHKDGQIHTELDIIYTKEQWAALQKGADAFSGLLEERYRWPNNVVPYEADNVFTAAEWQVIENAMQEWEKYTCLRFKPRTTEVDYIKYVDGSGCSSHVGRIGRRQYVTLARGCRVNRIVVHELGHAIGFHHEQTRPDRDEYVTILGDNVQDGRLYNFNKQPESRINSYGVPYDYLSVMHYSGHAFSKNGQPTILAKNTAWQNIMGRAPTLSGRDIQQANKMYKCADWCGPRSCPPRGFVNQYCACYCSYERSSMTPVYVCGLGGPTVPTTAIPIRPTTITPPPSTTPANRCVSDCKGLTTGDYQSCKSCKVYVTCDFGVMIPDRPCPNDLVWDDIAKECWYSSRTCVSGN